MVKNYQELDEEKEKFFIEGLINRAKKAMKLIEGYNQKEIDRLCQAVGWAVGNEKTFTKLAHLGVKESGLGDYEGRSQKRFKIQGILRDILGVKSMGIIEEIPEKGIIKYAKPAGVIAAIVPCTNLTLTPSVIGIFALKCKNAVIFSPHPRTKKASMETVNTMRKALEKEGALKDIFQCIKEPNLRITDILMAGADLVMATGGANLVKSAYSSGTPAYGVGAGNSTIIIDETSNIEEAARNTRISKISDNGSGCSADGNVIVEETIYNEFLKQLQKEGGYLTDNKEKKLLESALWDKNEYRTSNTIAITAVKIAKIAGFSIPEDKKFIIVKQDKIGKSHLFSREKLCPVLAIYKYKGFENALNMVTKIFDCEGKGHSCGIYSFDDEHIHQLALIASVSRIMVRQSQYQSNAGSFINGMPMTSSLGCGIWGGNITNENIHLKHYMNITWVSRPIPENRPSEEELFGEFYNT